MIGFVAPLTEFVQPLVRFRDSCSNQPGVAGVHEIVACAAPERAMLSAGAPVTCTTSGMTQKPPVAENCPFVIGVVLASGWPMVPLTANCPFVLEPPPPATLDQFTE